MQEEEVKIINKNNKLTNLMTLEKVKEINYFQ
jgi:hypothetical protein